MEIWERQIKLARYMLLGTVIITVLNLAFLLGNVQMYVTYHAALPYYLVWLGKLFDNGLSLGAANGVYTATGLVMAGAALAVWVAVWWLAGDKRVWLKVGTVLAVADMLVLLVVAFGILGDPMSCFWEGVIHAAVIWEMNQGLKAWKQKEEYLARQKEQEAEPVIEYV